MANTVKKQLDRQKRILAKTLGAIQSSKRTISEEKTANKRGQLGIITTKSRIRTLERKLKKKR